MISDVEVKQKNHGKEDYDKLRPVHRKFKFYVRWAKSLLCIILSACSGGVLS